MPSFSLLKVYEPLVNIAKEVIEKNQLKSNDIKVIPKRSTQIEIGRGVSRFCCL